MAALFGGKLVRRGGVVMYGGVFMGLRKLILFYMRLVVAKIKQTCFFWLAFQKKNIQMMLLLVGNVAFVKVSCK